MSSDNAQKSATPSTPTQEQLALLATRQELHSKRLKAMAESFQSRSEVAAVEAKLLASGYHLSSLASW